MGACYLQTWCASCRGRVGSAVLPDEMVQRWISPEHIAADALLYIFYNLVCVMCASHHMFCIGHQGKPGERAEKVINFIIVFFFTMIRICLCVMSMVFPFLRVNEENVEHQESKETELVRFRLLYTSSIIWKSLLISDIFTGSWGPGWYQRKSRTAGLSSSWSEFISDKKAFYCLSWALYHVSLV